MCISCHRKYDLTPEIVDKNRESHRQWVDGKCKWGHDMNDNLYQTTEGKNRCRGCVRAYNRASKLGLTLAEYMEMQNV